MSIKPKLFCAELCSFLRLLPTYYSIRKYYNYIDQLATPEVSFWLRPALLQPQKETYSKYVCSQYFHDRPIGSTRGCRRCTGGSTRVRPLQAATQRRWSPLFVTSSYFLLVVRGAPSSILAPNSDALCS